jgi:hypothetical protein
MKAMHLHRMLRLGPLAFAAAFVGAAGDASLSSASAAAAAPTVNGNVNVGGHVAGGCTVLVNGGNSQTFSGTIDLGSLAGSDGKLAPGLTGSTIAGASLTFSVLCVASRETVSLSATTMQGSAAGVSPNFTKTIDYTARLDLHLANSTTSTFSYATLGAPPAVGGPLPAPLSGNANNVIVSVNSLVTNGSQLQAGNYGQAGGGSGGIISVLIAPI